MSSFEIERKELVSKYIEDNYGKFSITKTSDFTCDVLTESGLKIEVKERPFKDDQKWCFDAEDFLLEIIQDMRPLKDLTNSFSDKKICSLFQKMVGWIYAEKAHRLLYFRYWKDQVVIYDVDFFELKHYYIMKVVPWLGDITSSSVNYRMGRNSSSLSESDTIFILIPYSEIEPFSKRYTLDGKGNMI